MTRAAALEWGAALEGEIVLTTCWPASPANSSARPERPGSRRGESVNPMASAFGLAG